MRRSAAILTVLCFLAASVDASASEICPAKIFVHANGVVDFDGTPFSNDAKLKVKLAEYKKSHPNCVPSLTAEQNIRFEAVGRVVVLLQEAGFLKVGYLTEPKND